MTREDEGAKDLLDTNLRDEIELVSDLVVAATATDRHFTPDEVDALLGLQDEGSGAAASGEGRAGPVAEPPEPPPGDCGEVGAGPDLAQR